MRLKAIRQARKLTQVQLARRTRVSQSYITHLEIGRKANPSLAILQRLAKVLRCSVQDLL